MTMGKHGECQHGHHPQVNKGSNGIILEAAFDGQGHQGGGPPRRATIRPRIPEAVTRMGQAG